MDGFLVMRVAICMSRVLGVIAGLVSAWFWLSAARVPIPAISAGPINTLTSVGFQLTLESKLNARAAIAAAVAVVLIEVVSPILEAFQRGRCTYRAAP